MRPQKHTPTPGTSFVSEAGYQGCISLENSSTRVVLDPNLGGRVLSYRLNGVEALYQDPRHDGVVWDGGSNILQPSAGRFDIGPEYGGPLHQDLWLGRWKAEIMGPRLGRLISPISKASRLQIVREFSLARNSSQLRCQQLIRNRGTRPVRLFHWSRTFFPGSGVALAPLPKQGRFPKGYALGGPGALVQFAPPDEPNVRVRDGVLEIIGPPSKAKFLLDVEPGWLAYVSRANLLFVKRFPVYPNRVYGELAANNASIWYSSKRNAPTWKGIDQVAEMEAIGPLEILAPAAACSFTEWWTLNEMRFEKGSPISLPTVWRILDCCGTTRIPGSR